MKRKCHYWSSFQCASLALIAGLFLCGCGGGEDTFAEPQKVYSLTQSTAAPSSTQIGGFWLKSVNPPQTAASGSIVMVKQIAPIAGTESTLKWNSQFPATLYPELGDINIPNNWKLYTVGRDDNGVFITVSMQEN